MCYNCMCYNSIRHDLTNRPYGTGGGVTVMTFHEAMLSLLISILGSILGTLILQMLGL